MSNQRPLTRAQRRYRRQGYTFEIATWGVWSRHLKKGSPIFIMKGRDYSWRYFRKGLMPGEVIRPIAATYLHNGRKP